MRGLEVGENGDFFVITRNGKAASRFLFRITALIALAFSVASCSSSTADEFAYPNAALVDGDGVWALWEKVLPPSGLLTEYEGKAYTTTDSLDDIILYYQKSLPDWDYSGRGTDPATKVEGAFWKKNDDLLSIYYGSLPDQPCCYLLVLRTHFQRPFYTTPLFYLGLPAILLILLFFIIRKRPKKV